MQASLTRLRPRRGVIALIAVVAAVTVVLGSTAFAFVSGGNPGALGDSTITWTGQGATGGVLGTTICGPDNAPYLLWIFTTDGGSATISGTQGLHLGGTGTGDYAPDTDHGNTFHFTTPYFTPNGSLTATADFTATDTGNGAWNLVISHGCAGAAAATVNTAVHDAAHNPVTSVPLGSTVHDSATITTIPSGVTLPLGSTVTFHFFTDGACGTEQTPASNPIDATSGTVDNGLQKGPLAAGSYSYRADFTSGNTNVVKSDAGDCEPFTVEKAQLGIVTQIHDASHNAVGGNVHVPLGSVVHDTATVSGQVAGFDIGAVSFTLNGNAVANGSPEAGFTARSVDSAPLAAGSYTYNASVAGTDNYLGATSADEPLTVDKAQLGIVTQIHDAGHNAVGGNVHVPLGSVVHDTATVSGQVAGFDIGAVSFTLNGNAVANGSPEAGFTARSVDSAPLAAGSYTYNASVAGTDNYLGATSADEPLTVDKAQLGIVTEIHDAGHNAVGGNVHVPLGSVVHDTATVSGQVAGFDIGAVSFTLNGNAVANGSPEAGFTARSVDSAPLAAGSYTYNASVAGTDNYLGATSADEPLTVDAQLGKTMGFWGNTNGQARILANGGYTGNSVDIGRGAVVDTQAESLKILPNSLNACGKGTPFIFSAGAQTASANCKLATGVNINSLNTLSAQTLALGYNIKLVTNYTGQTIGGLSCSATGTTLTSASTVNQTFTAAVALINGSSTRGATTQAQIGAMNTLLGCLNREA